MPDPELEVWVWAESSQVARILGTMPEALAALRQTQLTDARGKPIRPKEFMETVLR